jgi:hypothetical protein
MEASSQLHAPVDLPPGERNANTHWVGQKVGLDTGEEKELLPLPGIEPQPSSP